MTAPTTSPEAQAYLAAVELELADLPADDRRELLDDLALHLAELDEEGDGRTLESRLGASSEYASELRAAAGLPPRTTAAAGRDRTVAALARRLTGSRAVREVVTFVPQLRPAWWVLRGYLIVLVPCLQNINGQQDFPIPAPMGSHSLGVALVLAAVFASMALGRRSMPRLAAIGVVAANVVLAIVALNLLADAPHRLAERLLIVGPAAPDSFAASPLATRYGPVTNVLPYAQDGTPLQDVLLYDQDGRPLLVGRQLWWADRCSRIPAQPRAADGVPVRQSFPQRYVLDPSGVTLAGGPVTAGQCKEELPRPPVALPVFPKPAAKR